MLYGSRVGVRLRVGSLKARVMVIRPRHKRKDLDNAIAFKYIIPTNSQLFIYPKIQ